jgi:DNA repair protein RadC
MDLADRLLEFHGSVGAVLAAPRLVVESLVGEAQDAVGLIDAVRRIMAASLKAEFADAPLANPGAVVNYLKASLSFARHEKIRALYLDGNHRLILDELVESNSSDTAPLPSLRMVRTAVRVDASGILLAHNHPSGNPRPSLSDKSATRALASRLSAVGVTLHDHLIFSRSGWVSFRALGFLGHPQPFTSK